jgi:hypothetical protein
VLASDSKTVDNQSHMTRSSNPPRGAQAFKTTGSTPWIGVSSVSFPQAASMSASSPQSARMSAPTSARLNARITRVTGVTSPSAPARGQPRAVPFPPGVYPPGPMSLYNR